MPDDPINIIPAAITPCSDCPWLVSSTGQPAPNGEPISDKHRTRQWRELADGRLGACHLTVHREDDHYPSDATQEWIAAHKQPPAGAPRRECAGSVAAAMREVHLLLEAGGYLEYARQRSQPLTRSTALMWLRRVAGEYPDLPLREQTIDPAEIVDPGGDR